jgi:maleylacetoacetate isomerase
VTTLYSYFRSSAAWRVRIALAMKHVQFDMIPVNLRNAGGEQNAPQYRSVNPQGLVPCLVDEGEAIAQSLAICEYLEERYPEPPLLPRDPVERAHVRAFACAIACDIHPLNNLRVLQYLKRTCDQSQERIDAWCRHWIALGFTAIETDLARRRSEALGPYCFGSSVSLADICLVPQVANARRVTLDLKPFPRIVAIEQALQSLPAFASAQPSRQPDFVEP